MNTTQLLAMAMNNLRPNANWVIRGDTVDWLEQSQTKPTDAEIQAETTRLKAEYDSKQYQRERATEYPAIGDQLDALFHAGVFPPEMAALIQAVKDKYPKEQS
jgi:hypothetical protein